MLIVTVPKPKPKVFNNKSKIGDDNLLLRYESSNNSNPRNNNILVGKHGNNNIQTPFSTNLLPCNDFGAVKESIEDTVLTRNH